MSARARTHARTRAHTRARWYTGDAYNRTGNWHRVKPRRQRRGLRLAARLRRIPVYFPTAPPIGALGLFIGRHLGRGGGGQRSRRKRRGEPIAATAAAAAAAAAVGDGRDAETSAKEAAFTRLFIAPHMAVACAAPRKPAPRRNNGFYAALV
jgi:hypothetical protein